MFIRYRCHLAHLYGFGSIQEKYETQEIIGAIDRSVRWDGDEEM